MKRNLKENVKFKYCNHFHDYDHIASHLIKGVEDIETNPLVSVIMPIYNHPDFFRKSLLSVINQKCYFEYEIVIVDNGHPDYQPLNQKIIEDLYCNKIRYYVNEENIGGVGSENRGVQLARGEYISFCHDDDILYEDALQVLISTVNSNKDKRSAIWGYYNPIDVNDNILLCNSEWDLFILKNVTQYKVSLYDLFFKNYTNGCGSLYLKSCFVEIGGFCIDYVPCPDYAMNIFYTMQYGAIAIKKPTMLYRLSTQSDSSKVYEDVLRKDREIKNALIDASLKFKLLFKNVVGIVMKCEEYQLYKTWSEIKPLKAKYFIYRAIKQIIRNAILLIKFI